MARSRHTLFVGQTHHDGEYGDTFRICRPGTRTTPEASTKSSPKACPHHKTPPLPRTWIAGRQAGISRSPKEMIATAYLYSASATSGLRGRRKEQLGLASVWCGTQWWSSDAWSWEAILVPVPVLYRSLQECGDCQVRPSRQWYQSLNGTAKSKVLTNLRKSARSKRDALLIL